MKIAVAELISLLAIPAAYAAAVSKPLNPLAPRDVSVLQTADPAVPTATSTPAAPKPSPSGTTLHQRIKSVGKKYFGNIYDSNVSGKSQVTNILKQEFGAITAENSMKMDTVQGSQGNFNFGPGDRVVDFATQNKMLVRGHTLVWHSQLPGWVNSINNKDTLTNVIKNHVSKVMGRYKGKIYAWDVCNEVLNEDGSMRNSVYSRVLGEDFIGIAFKAAREADPNAKLYINDYNLDSPTHAKVLGMVEKVRKWKAAGAPIDGIGTQAHYSIKDISAQAKAGLEKLASVVDEVALTELDIYDASPKDYTNAVRACMEVEKCVGITLWGVLDCDSWIKEHNALIYDCSGKKKSAWQAVFDAIY